MIESRVFNFSAGGAPAVGSCLRTPLQNDAQRRSDFATLQYLQCNNYIHGSWSRMQRISARKLQISCNPLRLGAAEEGVSSWEDKLESAENEKGELLEGDHSYSERKDSIVDEEGNIDNIEQEQTRSPREDEAGSNLWSGEAGIKEGDKGEAIVDSIHVFPSQSRREVSPTQIQEHDKYGTSESACDKGSLFKKIVPNGYRGENGMQKEYRAEQEGEEEDKAFQVDHGRAPNDYRRRADLFGKSGEQFVAQKQRTERKNV